jgi:parallel beta-helix repeat protein
VNYQGHQHSLTSLAATILVGVIAGCGIAGKITANQSVSPALTGRVHGGQQPVTQANIQLFAVGTTGDGSASTSLMTKAVTTDSSGSFVLTGAYTCPTPTSTFPGEVYLVASGGNPGLGSGNSNSQLILFAALGACSSLTSSTFIDVDELTAIASIAALAPYMTSATAIGSGSSDAAALHAAMATVNEYVNLASGGAPGPALPSGYYASTIELNTLADALSACVNSTGGVSGDGSACGNLFAAATPASGTAPTDTSTAILDILQNPTHNTAAIYNLVPTSPPFQTTLTQAPATWALPIEAPVSGAGSLSFSAYSYSVNESAGSVTLIVNRNSGNTGAVGVSYSTSNSSANAGTDFTYSAGTLSWASGDNTAATITIPILDAKVVGGTRSFTVSLSSATGGATLASPILTTVTIADNDLPPSSYSLTVNSTNPASGVTIAASPADINAKSAGSTGATFTYATNTTVTLTAPANNGTNIFQGWSGCSPAVANSLTCTVAITAAKTVTANYYATPVGHTYYVSPTGNDSYGGTTIGTAFLTLNHAAGSVVAAGDVVYAMTGTYTSLNFSTPGTASAPIAFRAYPGQTPTVSFSSFTGIGFNSTAAYEELNGFTVIGNNQNVTLAQASTADAIANPGNYPQFNGNCITADGRTTSSKPNHLSILNNTVSNCGAGIGLNGVDYVTISGNTVFNCAWYSAYGTSAISVLASYNSDSSTATKIFITGNRIYNNYELVPYHVQNPLSITDGEGIIIDTNMNSSISTSGITYAAYTGRTLVANNVIYANGSSAVEVFQSAHVDVVNNASYGNIHTPVATAVSTTTGLNYAAPTGRGELALSKVADVNAYNNIWYSYSGQNPYKLSNCSSGCTANYNVYYNGSNAGSAVNGANDLYANPAYANAATQTLPAVDLSLTVGSPAIDSGTSTLAPATDFNGTARPQGNGYDRGAYEQ